jgi:hypothetical protein
MAFDASISINRVGLGRPARLKPTARNWSKVLAELQEGKLDTLGYASFAPNRREYQLAVWFQLGHEANRRSGIDALFSNDSMSLDVDPRLLRQGTVTVQMCTRLLRKAWERLHGIYGFADVFASRRTGLAAGWEEQEASMALRAKIGRYEVSSPRVDVRSKVPDAYWLNFLNGSHVEQLGGVERMRAKLPAAQIKPLPHDGLSIQLSTSPLYDSTRAWQADHAALARVLAPLLPERP